MRIVEITSNFQVLIKDKTIAKGMSTHQVIASWGEPEDIKKSVYQWEEYQEWRYGSVLKNNDKYARFKNGYVIDFADNTKR